MACGEAYEFLALTKSYPNIHWEFVGVDNDATVIDYMKKRFANTPSMNWYCIDATNEVLMKKMIPGRFDIVFIRHPNILHMPEIFSRILLNILPTKIKPNGMLFMSAPVPAGQTSEKNFFWYKIAHDMFVLKKPALH